MTNKVAIDPVGPVLLKHDPDELSSLRGMEVVPEGEVRNEAVRCTSCFGKTHSADALDYGGVQS